MGEVLRASRLEKLAGVHPQLVEVVKRIGYAMNELGFHVVVTGGVRTTAEQQALYAKGRTAPGGIVTNADGVAKRSNHQPHPDGFGHAVDVTFLQDDGTPLVLTDDKPTWNEKRYPFALLGAMAKSQGCVWGGDWQSIHDLPHVELPDGVPATGAGFAVGAVLDRNA